MNSIKILYAGDSPLGGAANYLLGVLHYMKADVVHVPPGRAIPLGALDRRLDAVILSDYSRRELPLKTEKRIVRQIAEGTGFLMIGGWGSFSGPYGHWKGSLIEDLLPVACLKKDDRLNFPGGALILPRHQHFMFQGLPFKNPPALVGINEIRPKPKSQTVLTARKIVSVGTHLTLDPFEHPLLVLDADPNKRIAALATDLAPHWCGGLVDWGEKRMKLHAGKNVSAETGHLYVQFVQSLIRWLAQK